MKAADALLAELLASPRRSVRQLNGRWCVTEQGQPVSARRYARSTVEALWRAGKVADAKGGMSEPVLYPTEMDRRSITSRANLGEHVPKPIDPEGSVVLSARVGKPLAARVDRVRGSLSRSEWLRDYLERTVA